MDSVTEVCKEQIVGWYDSIDRLRVGGVLRALQQAGSVVTFMKLCYPGEERPLRRFTELTQRLKSGVTNLVWRGVPYLEAARVSDPEVQAWLKPLYGAGPRAGSLVAIVRTIEHVSSFSCRPRKHKRAKGHPKTGRRTVNTAEHHLTRARHQICVYYFFVYDTHWGRASIRLSSYVPFEVSLHLNGHDYLERQMLRQRRQITMAENAVAKVADWKGLRELAAADLEPAVRRFAAWQSPSHQIPQQLLPLVFSFFILFQGHAFFRIPALEAVVLRRCGKAKLLFENLLAFWTQEKVCQQ